MSMKFSRDKISGNFMKFSISRISRTYSPSARPNYLFNCGFGRISLNQIRVWAWLVKWILSLPSVRKVVGATPSLAAT